MTAWTLQPANGNNNHHTLRQSIDFGVSLLFITEIRQFSPIWTDFVHQRMCVSHSCTEERLARFSQPVFKEHERWLVFFLGEALVCAAFDLGMRQPCAEWDEHTDTVEGVGCYFGLIIRRHILE